MQRFAFLAALAAAGLAQAADDKGTKVKFGDFSSTAPAEWVKEEPPESVIRRFAQFKLPKQGEDKSDAYIVVFSGLGGGTKANIDRWKMQMGGGDGKTTELKVAGKDATRLEIEGTYTGTSLTGKGRGDRIPDAKGVFYVLDVDDTVYHVRLVGPKKTVEHYQKGYDEWVKGFKK